MNPLVLIAYHDYPDTAVEMEVLGALGARVERVSDLLAPDVLPLAREAAALMVTTQPVTDSMLEAMPGCRIVSRAGTGVDAIDIEAATRRGIWVSNVPDYSVDEVSTHAITLLLAHARRLPQLLDATRRGIWDYHVIEPITRLKGQTLGLIGFGRIGCAVGAKARGLGLTVLVYDQYVPDQAIQAEGLQPAGLETVLRESDFVSLHLPLTDETRGIMNAERLALMKPSALLINTARGGLVDEDALLEALRAGRLGRAALDVLASEPPTAGHPLLQEPHAWITPHVAWYSEAASIDMRQRAAEEVVHVLSGGPPRSRVNQLDGAASRIRR